MSEVLKAQVWFVALPYLLAITLMTFRSPRRGEELNRAVRWAAGAMAISFFSAWLVAQFGLLNRWVMSADHLTYLFIAPMVFLGIWVQRMSMSLKGQ